jgi:hypothetical protein
MFSDIHLPTKRDSIFADRESHLDLLSSSTMSLYGQDSSLSGVRSSTLGRVGAPIVTTVSYFNHMHFFFGGTCIFSMQWLYMKFPLKLCTSFHITIIFFGQLVFDRFKF